jgi:hypothetical protein
MADPTKPRTPHRHFRSADDDWKPFVANTGRADSDASKTINAFIRWYNRVPGADLPDRPPAEVS